MRVIVLGCGGSAGVPLIGGPDGRGDWGVCDPAEPRNRRSRPAIVVAAGGTQLLVDTGPDLRSQLLSCGINRIDAVLYTHAHADHVSGIDDVRILNRIVGRPLEAWGLPHTLAELSERFRYAFQISENQNFFYKPALIARPLDPPARTRIGALEVHPFRQNHGFSETLGFRIGPFAYPQRGRYLARRLFPARPAQDPCPSRQSVALGRRARRAAHRAHSHGNGYGLGVALRSSASWGRARL
jgi:phosphoribosyl 1,2-cyclic phosphate phosphodiesterase